VAQLVQAFGSTVYGYDPFMTHHPVCTMVPLETLCATCDIVSLHLPLLPETRGLMDGRLFALMKPNALLVNTSRGEIVDEEALYDVVKSGRISAALDVFCEEPYRGKLLESGLPVVLSPHQGSSAAETRDVMEAEAAMHIVDFFKEH
jgi:phosphoglycerate dehydrogenase-like enzyme